MSQDEDYAEKRKHQRVHTRIEIPYWKYVKVKHKRDVNIGFVKNISKGGFFIETESVHAKGDQLGFEFYLPNSPKAVEGMARVAWSKQEASEDSTEGAGMGLEFVEFQGDGEAILMEFIDSEIRKQKPAP